MTSIKSQPYLLELARKAYGNGENVMEKLRNELKVKSNTLDIIEVSYDMQAGSYVEWYRSNTEKVHTYVEEIVNVISPYIKKDTHLLDIGTGEITTFSLILEKLSVAPKKALAFDISWSRIRVGLDYASQIMSETKLVNLEAFVAETGAIPFPDNSIDVSITSHALEPNGSKLRPLLKEIFRVTNGYCILFEPCFERAGTEAKNRMDALGYIKDIENSILMEGGILESVVEIKKPFNHLNPTFGFVVKLNKQSSETKGCFSVPGTSLRMREYESGYFSSSTGLYYPVVKDIPILRQESGILVSDMVREASN